MKKIFALLVVLGLVFAALALPALAGGQQWVMWHHESQGHGPNDQTQDICLPDDSTSGHNGHTGDYQISGPYDNNRCVDDPTDVPPTDVPTDNPTEPPCDDGQCETPVTPTRPQATTTIAPPATAKPPCRGDSCGGIARSGVNFQPGRLPTIPGTVFVTDAGGLSGKIFFSAHFNAGEQWSGWIEFPLQFGVSGSGLQAWWVPDAGGAPVQLLIANPWISTVIRNMLEIDWP